MRRLLIIGAGGFGLETLEWLLTISPERREWDEVAGFLDSNLAALDGRDCSHRVLATPDNYKPQIQDRFLCTIGTPRTRHMTCLKLQERGAIFASAVHPLADVSRQARINDGCIISPWTCVGRNAEIGRHSFVLAQVVVAHDSRIGTACNLSPGAKVSGGCDIGDCVMIGTNASLLPRAIVGDGAVVGAGSVVLRRVPPGTTVIGIPAKQIGKFQ